MSNPKSYIEELFNEKLGDPSLNEIITASARDYLNDLDISTYNPETKDSIRRSIKRIEADIKRWKTDGAHFAKARLAMDNQHLLQAIERAKKTIEKYSQLLKELKAVRIQNPSIRFKTSCNRAIEFIKTLIVEDEKSIVKYNKQLTKIYSTDISIYILDEIARLETILKNEKLKVKKGFKSEILEWYIKEMKPYEFDCDVY